MDDITKIIKIGELFEIKVITKSSFNAIYVENGTVKVKINEIPEKGKANKAIIDLFSKTFQIPKKNIEIIRGEKSSKKILRINK